MSAPHGKAGTPFGARHRIRNANGLTPRMSSRPPSRDPDRQLRTPAKARESGCRIKSGMTAEGKAMEGSGATRQDGAKVNRAEQTGSGPAATRSKDKRGQSPTMNSLQIVRPKPYRPHTHAKQQDQDPTAHPTQVIPASEPGSRPAEAHTREAP